MQKSHLYFITIILLLSGCQLYMDPRNEPLMLVTEEEWTELKTVKETNFEIETDPLQPPSEIPGSEKIGFIDATTARLYGCRALTTLKMMHEGPYDYGIIAIKNRALSLGADMMVAGKMGEYKVGTAESNVTVSQFNVELYRCPDSAFEKELGND
mgnify:FL=1